VTFTPATGKLAGTPASGTGGTYSITFKAHNSIGTDATQAFTLTVNQGPAITSANATTFRIGTAGTFTVTTTGVPTPTLIETGALPSGVTFADNGNGTGTLSGTPAAGTAGSYAITFKAHNGAGTDATQSFTLTVTAAQLIITTTSLPDGQQGVAYSANMTFSGGTPPVNWQLTGGAFPNGVTLNASSGLISGTPTSSGQFTVTIGSSADSER
jgi:hypothetical protein